MRVTDVQTYSAHISEGLNAISKVVKLSNGDHHTPKILPACFNPLCPTNNDNKLRGCGCNEVDAM